MDSIQEEVERRTGKSKALYVASAETIDTMPGRVEAEMPRTAGRQKRSSR